MFNISTAAKMRIKAAGNATSQCLACLQHVCVQRAQRYGETGTSQTAAENIKWDSHFGKELRNFSESCLKFLRKLTAE